MSKAQEDDGGAKLKRKQYEEELRRLQAELCILSHGAVGKILDQGKDRLIARAAEQSVVVAVAGADVQDGVIADALHHLGDFAVDEEFAALKRKLLGM
jgi:hypothetical protein